MRKNIGLDLDDVLLNFNDSFLDFHNNEYGTNYKREDITSYYIEDFWKIEVKEIQRRLGEFYKSVFHKNATPISGAVEVVARLSREHNLHIVTASPEEIKEEVEDWLSKHFGKRFSSISFTRKTPFDKSVLSKKKFCEDLKVDIFVDDALHNAEEIASLGIPVLLLDTPWNQGIVGPPIKRVYSWQEIEENI